jgi:hypothetical protein
VDRLQRRRLDVLSLCDRFVRSGSVVGMLNWLRIAFSATCGIICLLLVALWVRSYWWHDIFYRQVPQAKVQAESTEGALLFFNFRELQRESAPLGNGWTRRSQLHPRTKIPPLSGIFRSLDGPIGASLQIPLWIATLVPAALAAAPWFRWRFSLRTLLVAMTLAAVGLGLIVRVVR